MPKPPEFPTIDWRSRFQEGMTFEQWLEHSEKPEHRERILATVDDPPLQPGDHQRLAALAGEVRVFAIAEDWCPDVARHLPLVEAMARACEHLTVRYFLRHQAERELERHLENGSESVPRFIVIGGAWKECGDWGPMGTTCREFLSMGRACDDMKTARELVFDYYERHGDCREEIGELLHLFELAGTVRLDGPGGT